MSKIILPFVRSAYNYDVDEASNASAIHFLEPTLCDRSQAEDTDINTIVRRFGLTGELPTGVVAPTYDDFTGISDYSTAAAMILAGNSAFAQMPADVRSRFQNSPSQFLDFIHDASNYEEAIELGLVIPKPEIPLDKEEKPV